MFLNWRAATFVIVHILKTDQNVWWDLVQPCYDHTHTHTKLYNIWRSLPWDVKLQCSATWGWDGQGMLHAWKTWETHKPTKFWSEDARGRHNSEKLVIDGRIVWSARPVFDFRQDRDVSLRHRVQTSSGSAQPPNQCAPGTSSEGGVKLSAHLLLESRLRRVDLYFCSDICLGMVLN
jgi:hypothetical protein